MSNGFLDSSPLINLINEIISDKIFHRKLLVGAIDYIQGHFIQMDSDDMEDDERTTAVLASASIPGLLPPTKLREYNLIDGGSAWNLNIIGAINKCKEIGFTEDEKIVLDVIILQTDHISAMDKNKKMTTLQYYERIKEIKMHMRTLNDLAEEMQAHPNLDYRYFI